ncbi:uncharacterized protein LOC8276201 [Ricinus communis]|uniref:uncharacterized protein LOC8276201 n=1 Tax=Ricinus communis TaxID=3988 RepID=UPI00201A2C27|nr:uncharacterized protein LOC8276201 [Ricinus communis]XP_048227572.1 uncharacterized protein LOC8276201 [Ricinus communis]XP_048227573.1 uncharacterized protein LOC8276201 [Ricinus communis]
MANAISIKSELENRHTDTMILEVTKHLGTVPYVSIKIPPGEVKDLCYGDLHIEDNPDRPPLVSVFVEGAAEVEKKYIFSSFIRDHAKLVLNFENGKVTVLPVKGNVLARIGCIVKLRRTISEIGEQMGKKLNKSSQVSCGHVPAVQP